MPAPTAMIGPDRYIKMLKRAFNDPRSRPSAIFSTPGFIDFHCSHDRIEQVANEEVIDIEDGKGLVLGYAENSFFEPVFVVHEDKLRALKSRIEKTDQPGSTTLTPEDAWGGRTQRPHLIEGAYSREGQVRNALHHFDNQIAILDDLLAQLTEAQWIFKLARNGKVSEEWNAQGLWRLCIYRIGK